MTGLLYCLPVRKAQLPSDYEEMIRQTQIDRHYPQKRPVLLENDNDVNEMKPEKLFHVIRKLKNDIRGEPSFPVPPQVSKIGQLSRQKQLWETSRVHPERFSNAV